MKDGLPVFDADAHVLYPSDLWQTYLDERFRERVTTRQPIAGFDAYNPTVVDGRWTQSDITMYGQFQKYISWTKDEMIAKYGEDLVLGGFTGPAVAEALGRDGVDVAFIYGPEYDLWVDGIDSELQAAMSRAYNRWGQEMRESSGGRVNVAGPVPLNDVARAVEEIQHAYDELGTRAFWARANLFNHRTLGDRYYEPIWTLIEELGVPFSTHEFMGLRGTSYGSNRFTGYSEWHAIVHPFEAMGAMSSMIFHGVFERHPRLRVAYLEAGCGWLPSWLHRLDEHLELAGAAEFPELTMSATEYFQRNCWISTESDDPYVADVIRWLGDGHIVYESDFPHPESKFPHSTEGFLELEGVARESKARILWDNAAEFYAMPELDAFASSELDRAAR